jgi:predicted RNase H-like nuclease (RuvC/YqgF family)
MRPFLYKIVGVGLLLAAYASWLLMRQQSLVALEQQAREVTGQLAQLAAENERLSNQVAQTTGSPSASQDQMNELLRLRSEVGRLRRQTNEIQRLREENTRLEAQAASNQASSQPRQNSGANPAGYWPKESWAFQGFATPEAALLSSLWAANSGDMKTFLNSVTGEMQTQIQKDLEGKSESEIAARAMDEVGKIKTCQILNQETQPDGTVLLTVSLAEAENSHVTKLIMQQVGADWKFSNRQD